MATRKSYAYYIEGNSIAVVQQETNTTSTDLRSEDYGKYKSPQDTIADGLEIKYTYIPEYLIESTDTSTQTVSGWDQDNDGNFRLRASGSTNWTSSPDLSNVSYIVLENAGRFNGLHKVSSVTNNRIVTATKVSASTSETLFEETVTLYYDVSVMTDESFELDIPRYLQNALVLYLKSKMFEDIGDLEKMMFYQREFKRQVEKHSGGKVSTTHRIAGFWGMR